MPSYFLPYPKPQHYNQEHQGRKYGERKKKPYPHPQPDPDPSNPPSPLNLPRASPNSPLNRSANSPLHLSSTSFSGSSIRKPSSHNHHRCSYRPGILELQIVCGDLEDPSLVVVFGLRFRDGKRPKVRFSVGRGYGHGRIVELGHDIQNDGVKKRNRSDEDRERVRERGEETRGRKRRREHAT